MSVESKKRNIQVRIDKNVMLNILETCDEGCYAVYSVILSHKNKDYNSCYPSLSLLAKESGCSISTVQRRIGKLNSGGFLKIESGSFSKNSHYYFPKEPDMYTKDELTLIDAVISKPDARKKVMKSGTNS